VATAPALFATNQGLNCSPLATVCEARIATRGEVLVEFEFGLLFGLFQCNCSSLDR
jgi:hypothetical protein